MRKFDLVVIGIGLVSVAVTLNAAEPANADNQTADEPEAVATGVPSMGAEQQQQYGGWPPDRQAMYDTWGADTQAYFWSLTPSRQEYFWQLSDDDRAVMITMEPAEREEAWQMIEGRVVEPQ